MLSKLAGESVRPSFVGWGDTVANVLTGELVPYRHNSQIMSAADAAAPDATAPGSADFSVKRWLSFSADLPIRDEKRRGAGGARSPGEPRGDTYWHGQDVPIGAPTKKNQLESIRALVGNGDAAYWCSGYNFAKRSSPAASGVEWGIDLEKLCACFT